MCRQFQVTSIFHTTEATNYFPVNSIFAVGPDGLYVHVGIADEYSLKKENWPRANKKTGEVTLFRDRWNYFCDHSHENYGTYYLEVMHAKRKYIVGGE